jgi:hypothetical protein
MGFFRVQRGQGVANHTDLEEVIKKFLIIEYQGVFAIHIRKNNIPPD